MASKKQTDDSSEGSAREGGSNSFANDSQRASEAGKKGGDHSHGSAHKPESSKSGESQRGGSGSFANDKERASETGKQGGEHSHAGK